MSKPDTWMPLYIGDYLQDTTRLSTEQHGAYLLLIMDYWINGPLPDDDAALAQVTRMQPGAWKKTRPSITRFFSIENGEWRHKRIDVELADAQKFIEKQKANGAKGGRPKKIQNTTQEETQKKPMGFGWDNPNHNPNHNPNESPSPSPSQVNPSQQPSSHHQPVLREAGIGVTTGVLAEIPPIPDHPGQWMLWFNQTQGTDYNPGSRFDRGSVWQTFTRWCGAGMSTEAVAAGISRAVAEAKGQISNLPAYVEKLLLNDQQASETPKRISHADASKLAASRAIFGTEIEGEKHGQSARIIDASPVARLVGG